MATRICSAGQRAVLRIHVVNAFLAQALISLHVSLNILVSDMTLDRELLYLKSLGLEVGEGRG